MQIISLLWLIDFKIRVTHRQLFHGSVTAPPSHDLLEYARTGGKVSYLYLGNHFGSQTDFDSRNYRNGSEPHPRMIQWAPTHPTAAESDTSICINRTRSRTRYVEVGGRDVKLFFFNLFLVSNDCHQIMRRNGRIVRLRQLQAQQLLLY